MRRSCVLACLVALSAAPAGADVPEAVHKQILPGYARFAEAAAALDTVAQADCRAEALRPAYHAAFDAWMGVSHLRLGPVEDQGRALAIAFWPDPKAIGARQVAALLEAADPAMATPEGLAQVSVAAKGLFGVERLIHGAPYGEADYACTLVRAMAADLAGMAAAVQAGWGDAGTGGYADLLLSAGAPENVTFLTTVESRQALFTQLITGLEFTATQRLGRPLGSFDQPLPERAEALASGRPLRNVMQSLTALQAYAGALAIAATPLTDAAFARALGLAQALPDPTLGMVADASGRLKVEILQQAVLATRDAALAEIGGQLQVSAGFNAADGD